MKKLLLFMLSMIISVTAWCANGDIFTSLTEEGIQMKFRVSNEDDKTCYVYGVNTSDHNTTYMSAYAIDPLTEGKVTIPASVNGYTVTYIGAYAFLKCMAVTSVVIPDGIQFIAKGAFEGCTSLLSVNIPSSVTNIKDYAFYNCTGLQTMTIEEGLTTIGTYAFYECTSLEALSLPSGVTTIGDGAFYKCTSLEALSLPSGVTTIGDGAFYGCTALASIVIPSSVEEMSHVSFQETAWYNNQSDGLVYIGDFLLGYKGTIPDDAQLVVREGTKKIASSAIGRGNVGRRHSVMLPNSVTKIGNGAFYESFMANITLSKNLTTIGQGAFRYSSLTHIVIPECVTSIGVNAFEGCSKLNTITVSMSTPPVLTANPFGDVSNNATLLVPKGSKSSYETAYYWQNFETITELPANYGSSLSINTSAGQLSSWIPNGYDDITSLTITGSINANDFAVIKQMTNLETLEVSASIATGIPVQAFQNHQHLTTVSFTGQDNGFYGTRIGAYAFDGCTSLTSYNGLIASLGDFCFRNTNVGELTLSAEEYWEYDGEDWCGPYTNTSNREFYHVGKNPIFAADGAYFTTEEDYELGNYSFDGWVFSGLYNSNGTILYALPNRNSHISYYITTIAEYAVSGNNDLISFSMQNVTTIGDGFLYKCPKLRSITCPNGNSAFAVVNDVLYSKNKKTLLKYPCAKTAEEFIIPSTVEQIGKWAFEGAENLTTIVVKTATPPVLADLAFDDFDATTVTLYVPSGSLSAYQAADGWNQFDLAEYVTNDVNMDGETDVVDVVDIARFVVGTPAETFVKVLADINSDGGVDIGDAVTLVNEIAGDQNFARAYNMPKGNTEFSDELTLTESSNSLSLCLANQRYYTAFQFDLYVPEGVDVMQIQINKERKQKHQLLYNKVENGHWRVVALSTSNRTFEGNNGELLNVALGNNSSEGISLSNIKFFDAKGSGYQFNDLYLSGTTMIQSKDDGQWTTDNSSTVYDLQGRKMVNGKSSNCQLPRGVYIVNGKKVMIK